MDSFCAVSGTMLVLLSMISASAAQSSDSDDYDNTQLLIASSTVAVLLFILCCVMACVFYNCYPLYRSCGYDRIPKHELKRKEFAKTIIQNGTLERPRIINPVPLDTDGASSWVQAWNESQTEERQDAVMQLGPEDPDTEFRIETTLVDGDQGVYNSINLDGHQPINHSDSLYSTVDKGSTRQGGGASSTSGNATPLSGPYLDSTVLL